MVHSTALRITVMQELSFACRPDGRIDLKRKVPKEPMSWVVGALSMSIDDGLGVVTEPARVGVCLSLMNIKIQNHKREHLLHTKSCCGPGEHWANPETNVSLVYLFLWLY